MATNIQKIQILDLRFIPIVYNILYKKSQAQ